MIKRFLVFITIMVISVGLFLLYWPETESPLGLRQQDYSALPQWQSANLQQSFKAFKKSCGVFLKMPATKQVGSQTIPMTAGDWHPACRALFRLNKPSNARIKAYFERWFVPFAFYQGDQAQGLFTGYYMPTLKGSLKKTDKYPVPLYGLPNDLVTIKLNQFDDNYGRHQAWRGRVHERQVVPYYKRRDIEQGVIKGKAPVVAWIADRIDRHFLEIEGSGVIETKNNGRIYVGYAGQNGATYTPLANVLIKKGVMTKDNASMQRIKQYLSEHPNEANDIMYQNESFVFFERSRQQGAIGAQNLVLTDGYSMAVDRKHIPLGTPLWLTTTHPDEKTLQPTPLNRLMIAQDTGGAIRGPVRGDFYWGEGKRAARIAGHMKHQGTYWLLLPKAIAVTPKSAQ